jgi:uncharacterized protein
LSTPTGDTPQLGLQQARHLHLAAQGLLMPPRAKATRARVLATIERMRLLQIDTIHVVARSPYLVLFSRLGPYDPTWLESLLARAKIYECWAHEACFAPSADHALLSRRERDGAAHWSQRMAQRIAGAHRAAMHRLVAHVRETGAVKVSDFERTDGETGGGWWGWKDEKRWLEACFALGELMVARRENFHRVYDIAERVLAKMPRAEVDYAAWSPAQVRREVLLRSVRALGITQARWIADYYRLGRKVRDAELDVLVAEGALLRVAVRGWKLPAYVHPDHEVLLRRAFAGGLRASHTTLLSPFDPVVWDRERASTLFDFDYRIECYTPAEKRRYGYFVLPILRRGKLVGRLDAKAHRAEGRFEVKALFLEDGIAADDALLADIATAIRECAAWHETPDVTLGSCEPKTIRKPLRAALAAVA